MLSHRSHRRPWIRAFFCPVAVGAGLLLSQACRGTLYLQEAFNYSLGLLGNYSPWVGPTSLITVVSPGLTCRNVADFLPPGNAVAVVAGGTAQAVTYRPLDATLSSGVLYCAALIKYTNINANVTIAGLLPSSMTVPGGPSADPCDLSVIAATGGYKFGIRAKGNSAVYASTVCVLNTVYLVVMKYDFATGRASLYVSPKPGESEPASPDASCPLGSAMVSNLKYFYLRVYDATAGCYLIDTLRAGTAWGDVTPWAPAPPASQLTFTAAPVAGTAGAALYSTVVQALDANTNAVPTNNVPITVTPSSGSFASGTTTAYTDASGKAKFDDLAIITPGTYTITASASGIGMGLNAATSSPFEIGLTNAVGEQGQALSALLDSLQVEQVLAGRG